ncbi:MAG TPA: pitrilysin family protein [Allosphingosinicella sp.]|jgi:predicted Zn-dependent peptidase|uniref:M16 family metallopeptidase n=1 Tax=Allosphingosinicella sp. TaxID=2823234 RepID=UPI002F295C6D
MRHRLLPLLVTSAFLTPGIALAQTGPMNRPMMARPMPVAPAAPVAELVRRVDIPFESFTLPNGLKVLVHEDRKAPVVAVSVWYNVGSKDEPKGKTGFAHLFEHLMFNGSENSPGDFFEPLQQIGATDYNGTTSFDRTNYFQTVPTAAIERALFLESDRMGHLLGAVTQEKLDNQRGVVQNEKRQGDNRPGGLVFYKVLEELFPEGHPYRHTPIGSMADLDAASLDDVKQWFRDNYGPNNAVLVLAGDINARQARPLVEKYFGEIKRGPVNVPAAASVPVLKAPKAFTMRDRVAATTVSRYWPVPGQLDKQMVALDIAGSVLGGLSSSRLDNALVRDEKIAVQVSAGLSPFQRAGLFSVSATVKPGVDPALVERRLDELVAQFVAEGPRPEEVTRAATTEVAARVRGLEQVGGFGGKAVALAEGQVYAGDPLYYKKTLAQYARTSPAQVRAAMQQWLRRPPLKLTLAPGEREAYEEAKTVAAAAPAATKAATKPQDPSTFKRRMPDVGQLTGLDFPDVQHATLSNGVKVHYAQRTAVPTTLVSLSFDAGQAADPTSARGTQALMLGLIDEGTTTRSSVQIAEEQERLGANISAGATIDRTNVSLNALTPNLAPSLDLLADLVKNAAFAPAEVERVKAQQLTAISQELKDPNGIAQRTLPGLLYGENHPYATSGSGNPAAVAKLGRADLVAFKDRWLRPDNLEIFVVSDVPLAQLRPMLDQRFGNWAKPAGAKGTKSFAAKIPVAKPRVVLIDRPGSPQSIIYGGLVTPFRGTDDLVDLISANDILGGNFLSRINMDLRETKGWSYGVRGTVQRSVEAVPYIISAPVQADRTGDSLAALMSNVREFTASKGVSEPELARTVANNIRSLPGSFETSPAVLNAMQTNVLYKRPDNYYETLASIYQGQTVAKLDAAARRAIRPENFVWVVVGEAAKVQPQLAKLGLPVELRAAEPEAAPGMPPRTR